MKQLKEYFIGKGQVKGFTFTQVEKSAFAFIYEVNTGSSTHYEVFKRVENDFYKCISYPTNKGFGVWAWTFSELNKAEEKFDELELLFNSKIGL